MTATAVQRSGSRRRSVLHDPKHGQGYWTRMGTAIGAAVLGLMLAYTLFDKLTAYYLDQLWKQLAARSRHGFIVGLFACRPGI